LIYGYAQQEDGSLDYQTMARCDVGAALFARKKVSRIFLTVEIGKAGVSMAEAMKEHLLRSHNEMMPSNVVILPFGRNTAGETDALLAYPPFEEFKRVYVVSTWYHIPRILYLWWVRGRMPRPAIAWRGAHWIDVFVEPLKMMNSLLRPRSSAKLAPRVVAE
jgi:hypothetical protein